MKFFALIFSFYFFALAVIPCSDQDDCKFPSGEQSAFSTTDHSDHDQDTENCSPFCMCACCGHSCTVQYFQTALNLIPQTGTQKIAYQSIFLSEVSFSIWQPPKIS